MNRNLNKIIIWSIALLLVASSLVYNQEKPLKGSNFRLKVLTFNIRYGNANDGTNSWENRKEILFDLLKEEKADVIGLQEALRGQLDELKTILPQYAELGVGREDGKTDGEYSAILYLKKRFDADSSGNFWFSDKPTEPGSKTWGNNVTRICTWALLKDKLTSQYLYFYNLHIDHESQNSREKSVNQLLNRITGKNYPVIITGDFNAGETNMAIKNILSAGLIDSYRKVHPAEKEISTYHAFKGNTAGEKIDFIFCTNDLLIHKADIIRKNKDGKYPSDHFPMSAVVGF